MVTASQLRERTPDAGPAKILLDTPAVAPQLGFDGIATALAQVISGSEPRFAVGLFGGWGSGKTTLMRAIGAALSEPNVVKVEFNAWRFEREPLLLVPLLDTIRAALVEWADARPTSGGAVWEVARRVGRVVRALASGLSGGVGLPGAATVNYDVGKALAELHDVDDQDRPQSLFVAAFRELAKALRDLGDSGVDRVVVFVDDLDRCLPDKALDVLESIKLFFDLPGFVFVVGLDEEAVDRAVQSKFAGSPAATVVAASYPQGGTSTGDEPVGRPAQLGREYVKKVFQVPYALPPVVFEDIEQLLEGMYAESQLPQHQVADFDARVRPYLRYVAVERRVNPREVKRFLNAYTLQTLVRPDLDASTVLALQTLTFRYEWDEALSDVILADPTQFLFALRRYRQGDGSAFADLAPHLGVLHPELAEYLRSEQAEPLVRQEDLGPYVSSLRTTASVPGWLTDAYAMLGEARRAVRGLADDPTLAQQVAGQVDQVMRQLERMAYQVSSRSGEGARLTDLIKQSSTAAAQLGSAPVMREAIDRLLGVIGEIYRELRWLRGDVSPLSAS